MCTRDNQRDYFTQPGIEPAPVTRARLLMVPVTGDMPAVLSAFICVYLRLSACNCKQTGSIRKKRVQCTGALPPVFFQVTGHLQNANKKVHKKFTASVRSQGLCTGCVFQRSYCPIHVTRLSGHSQMKAGQRSDSPGCPPVSRFYMMFLLAIRFGKAPVQCKP